VGTGFHPELTGRENVYLNGAILGMSRAEIRRKFDDIVSFAGVEKFIDTPVKRYSSGMQVRLAFAVAAHLDPEILIIDEVLAVGDAEFQKRCLGKMDEVSRSGRTILFVSHNMAAVESLCRHGMLLEHGSVATLGSAQAVIQQYLTSKAPLGPLQDLTNHPSRPANLIPVAKTISLRSENGPTCAIRSGDSLAVEVTIHQHEPAVVNTVSIGILNHYGLRLLTCNSRLQGALVIPATGALTISCLIEDLRLTPGNYIISLSLWNSGALVDHLPAAAAFSVVGCDLYGTGRLPSAAKGFWLPRTRWSVSCRQSSLPCPHPR
jgi:lipopolysaccharide transport system ATP-binding protein